MMTTKFNPKAPIFEPKQHKERTAKSDANDGLALNNSVALNETDVSLP